jgi:hypothetical protein
MKLFNLSIMSAALFVIAALVACNGTSNSNSYNPIPNPSPPRDFAPQNAAGGSGEHLYVVRPYYNSIGTPTPMPGGVTVFAPDNIHPAWKVPDADASGFQFSIAVDGSGNVYEAHEDLNNVVVYPPHSGIEQRVIRAGLLHPFSLWFDRNENLYVTNYPVLSIPTPTPTPSGAPTPSPTPSGPPTPTPTPSSAGQRDAKLPPGWISVYAPGALRPSRTVTSPRGYVPMALAFDGSGKMYVANGPADDNPNRNVGLVLVYPRNGVRPERTISNGVHQPVSIAVDVTAGTLYVGNGNGNVIVYAAGKSAPSYELGAKLADSLALDSHGDVYVGDFAQPGSVSEYARGSRKPMRTMSAGSLGVNSVTLDALGNVYAADQFDNRVFVYAAGKTDPFRIYSVLAPGFIMVRP